jgi:3-oxoadipate enol-lactonase
VRRTKPTAVPVHAEVHGPDDAPAVVLVHPLGTEARVWEPQVAWLADRFRVIVYDQRGHGASPAPTGPYTVADLAGDLLDLLDRLDVDRAHLVGSSLGAMACLWVAANAPDRVDRLVTCSASAFLDSSEAWTDRAQIVRSNGTVAIVDGAVHRWFGEGHLPEPETLDRLTAWFVGTSDEGYAACCEAIGAMDLRDEIPRITAPTLVVAGDRDLAIPITHARDLAERIPGARLAIVEEAGHLLSLEQPAELNRLLDEHLGAAGGTG